MVKQIGEFQGEFRFLSNFYPAAVIYNGMRYSNNEAAFQAQKETDPAMRAKYADLAPNEAKRMGRQARLVAGWDNMRICVMRDCVSAKFRQNGKLAQDLLDTGDASLIEGNHWRDTFWGICGGKGENHLGQILMRLRADLRSERTLPQRQVLIRIKKAGSPAAALRDPDAIHVVLYGIRLDGVIDTLKECLSEARAAMAQNADPAWTDRCAVCQALERLYHDTGVPYQIEPVNGLTVIEA